MPKKGDYKADWSGSGRRGGASYLHISRALRSTKKVPFALGDSFFADDSILIGTEIELKTGKKVVKERMIDFEEKCHNGKEQSITFATKTAQNAGNEDR